MGVASGAELTAQKGGVRRVQRGGDFRGDSRIGGALLSDWPVPLGTTQCAQNDGFHTQRRTPLPKGTRKATSGFTSGGVRVRVRGSPPLTPIPAKPFPLTSGASGLSLTYRGERQRGETERGEGGAEV